MSDAHADGEQLWTERLLDAVAGLRRITSRTAIPRPKPAGSPYRGLTSDKWADRTRELIAEYPIASKDVVEIVLGSWNSIFESTLGDGFRIGQHIFPTPQIMGTLLHELIPLEMGARIPGQWRAQMTAAEKDLVCAADNRYSTEIKTSSDPSRIFANRSYGQETESAGKKEKSGYYLAVNFGKWPVVDVRPTEQQIKPDIGLIRLGWIDHTDWLAQKAATGQQSSLPAAVENNQLLAIYKG